MASLRIKDGDGSLLMGKTCGATLPNQITSITNIVKVDDDDDDDADADDGDGDDGDELPEASCSAQSQFLGCCEQAGQRGKQMSEISKSFR